MKQLLVVDDEFEICQFVKRFFEERGYNVTMVGNGEQAIEAVKPYNPDIILMDIMMPVMNGYQALSEIKKLKPHIKIVIVSAVDDQEQIDELPGKESVYFIAKPLSLTKLSLLVGNIV